jgi:hypothetical protein
MQNIRCEKPEKDLNKSEVAAEASTQISWTQSLPARSRKTLELENDPSRKFRTVLVGVEESRSHHVRGEPICPATTPGIDVHTAAEFIRQRTRIAIRRSRQIMRSAHKCMRPEFQPARRRPAKSSTAHSHQKFCSVSVLRTESAYKFTVRANPVPEVVHNSKIQAVRIQLNSGYLKKSYKSVSRICLPTKILEDSQHVLLRQCCRLAESRKRGSAQGSDSERERSRCAAIRCG